MTAEEATEALKSGKVAAVMDRIGDVWYPSPSLADPPIEYEPYRALVFADSREPQHVPEDEHLANWSSFDVKPSTPDVTPHAGIYPFEIEY